MRTILVTGANKGIGLAIARGILKEHDDTLVLLGSRDPARGRAAVESLVAEAPANEDRVEAVEIDVSKDDSVQSAARAVAARLGKDGALYAVVNNAGVGSGADMKGVLEVNTVGVRRVCEAFIPFISKKEGRIVNVTSAAGPNFVAKCNEERRRLFLDPQTEWRDLEALMQECLEIEGDKTAFENKGLGDGNPYGLSKACANTYTLQLARKHPELKINACTPGFIETDLTRNYLESQGKTASELGLKTPDEGARSPLFLLFGQVEGNGRYYGSDGERSPLDRYRSPGSPAYKGD